MALFVMAGDDVGDFNTPDFGVLLGSKATRDWLAGLTREWQEISDRKTEDTLWIRFLELHKHWNLLVFLQKITMILQIYLTEVSHSLRMSDLTAQTLMLLTSFN